MKEDCDCFTLKKYMRRNERFVGMDKTDGRFADVYIWECMDCHTLWLRYFLDYHWHRASGRWFRGLITEEVAQTVQSS